MNARRLALALAPLPIMLGSFGVSRWIRSYPPAVIAKNDAAFSAFEDRPLSDSAGGVDRSKASDNAALDLTAACREAARQWADAAKLALGFATLPVKSERQGA